MSYTHLTQDERYQIHAFRRVGLKAAEIARELNRSASTISREVKRNRGGHGYRSKQAHDRARRRASQSRCRRRIQPRQWVGIEQLIRQDWSPEQIALRAATDGTLKISHSWIYRHIEADRDAGGELYKHLRRANLKRRRYHHRKPRRPKIRRRVGIERRPMEVESRAELGHWEGDTIVGPGPAGALTLVERKSRFLRIGRLPRMDARTTADVARNRLHQISARVHSITFDNGLEFALHGRMAVGLSTSIYFADPYSPWQRGTNENTNGLIRQYLPKRSALGDLTESQVTRIEKRLNNRPRKCLGGLTPHEVFNNTRTSLTDALRG